MVGIIRYSKCKAKKVHGLRKIQIKNNIDREGETETESICLGSHKKLLRWESLRLILTRKEGRKERGSLEKRRAKENTESAGMFSFF